MDEDTQKGEPRGEPSTRTRARGRPSAPPCLHAGGAGQLPALIHSYAGAGVIAYFLMPALGELIMYRQSSGSFVSYAGELFGAKAFAEFEFWAS